MFNFHRVMGLRRFCKTIFKTTTPVLQGQMYIELPLDSGKATEMW